MADVAKFYLWKIIFSEESLVNKRTISFSMLWSSDVDFELSYNWQFHNKCHMAKLFIIFRSRKILKVIVEC